MDGDCGKWPTNITRTAAMTVMTDCTTPVSTTKVE
jgi:hypothetical protein